MNRHFLIHPDLKKAALLLMLVIQIPAISYAQTKDNGKDFRKTGWNIAPLPALSYGSDLGLQLGAYLEAYYFGDGSTYPAYMHKLVVEAAWHTKGSGIYHIFYDSKYLLPGFRITASASYLPNKMMAFHGFNGYASPYNAGQGGSFYFMDRNLLRVKGDIQGTFSENFGWDAGVAFYNYDIGPVNTKKYSGQPSLYNLYVENGIIRDSEKNGGSHVELQAGLVYDSRDNEPDPSRGIYTNVLLYGSPDIINGRDQSYLKLSAEFCHYVPLAPHRLTLAYRLAYQGVLAGHAPFYVQQNYNTLYLRHINSDILGGEVSLRGVLYNRILGNGVAWANAELRLRLFDFNLIGQHWYIATNPFFDAGMAVQPYRLDELKASDNSEIYNGDSETLHLSAGLGLKLVMNSNFVLSAEYGKPFDKRDGKGGIYLNLNYIF